MYYKVSPVIIIVLIVMVVFVASVGVVLAVKGSRKAKNNDNVVASTDIEPQLQLELSSEKEGQSKVTITANATTEDVEGIQSIVLPDGSQKRGDYAEYEVTKNGKYTFEAKGNNGVSTSLAIEVKNIREASSSEPYIPEGFSYIEGEAETGYVIEDKFGNQFVWVPVPSGKLTRNTLSNTKYEDNISNLGNSVAQNYGFYMARYEASSFDRNGARMAASMKGKMPWTNISYSDAAQMASDMGSAFEYQECQTALMNSAAWDTVLAWIDETEENYSTDISQGNYSGELRNTGETEDDIKNNICDLAGNVREWTTEIFKETTPVTNTSKNKNKNAVNEVPVSETVTYRVIRGGSANLDRPASSHAGYKENTSEAYWGFRMILYK